MKTAYLFPGQGSQSPGMGKYLYNSNIHARTLFETANDILGFRLTDIMFGGKAKALQQTAVTQPAVFLYSLISARTAPHAQPDAVAGHSLGELTALVASQVLDFEAGLRLVAKRAAAMQEACNLVPSTMAAILGLSDDVVEEVCETVEELVVPANYNCPGQVVISGSQQGVAQACQALKAAGAKKIVPLAVSGAFHSPLMEPALDSWRSDVFQTAFQKGICPIYQNVDAMPTIVPETIQENLVKQMTSPIKWTQTIQRMLQDGIQQLVVCGPGKVLQGLIKKIAPDVAVASV